MILECFSANLIVCIQTMRGKDPEMFNLRYDKKERVLALDSRWGHLSEVIRISVGPHQSVDQKAIDRFNEDPLGVLGELIGTAVLVSTDDEYALAVIAEAINSSRGAIPDPRRIIVADDDDLRRQSV